MSFFRARGFLFEGALLFLFKILDSCNNPYDLTTLEFAYSLDSACWSCFMSYNDILTNTVDINNCNTSAALIIMWAKVHNLL